MPMSYHCVANSQTKTKVHQDNKIQFFKGGVRNFHQTTRRSEIKLDVCESASNDRGQGSSKSERGCRGCAGGVAASERCVYHLSAQEW